MGYVRRAQLNAILKTLAPNVYFQPPEGFQMEYPCIVYNRDNIDTSFADNAPYLLRQRYQVTVIDRDGEGVIVEKVAALPECLFSNGFVSDSLYHDVFSLYF